MAIGAPPCLIEDARGATADEIRHAKPAFELTSTFAHQDTGPASLPQVLAPIDANLDEIA